MDEEAIKKQILFGVEPREPENKGRFQKGQSGNPKGRPKKTQQDYPLTNQPTLSALQSLADTLVPVREGGETHNLPWREVILRALLNRAGKGDPRAQAIAIRLFEKADEAKARQIRADNEIWRDYKQTALRAISKADKQGQPIPEFLPHPEDIVIDDQKGVHFIGPANAAEQKRMEETIRYRDALILQNALDHRSTVRLNGEPVKDFGSAGLFARFMDNAVAPRLRLSDVEWLRRSMLYEGIPKRTLLKELHAAWGKTRARHPRGFVFPELHEAADNLAAIFDYWKRETSA